MFIREFSHKNYLKGNYFRDTCGVVPRDYEFPEVQRVGAPDTAHICRISRLADHLRKKNFFCNNIIILKKRRRKITFKNLSFYWLFQFIFLNLYVYCITQSELRGHCEALAVFSSGDGLFWVFWKVLYSTLLYLPPLEDSTVSVDAGIEPRNVATLRSTNKLFN
jgi:hypothetical protein